MTKRLLALASLWLLCTSATYWVAPGGHYGRTTQYTGADTTVGEFGHALSVKWACDSASAGDVIKFAHGDWPTGDDMVIRVSGSQASGRITFVGDCNYPSTVSFPSISADSANGCTGFITIKGVRSRDRLSMYSSANITTYDSLAYCVVDGVTSLESRDHSTYVFNTFGDSIGVDNFDVQKMPANNATRSVWSDSNTVKYNRIRAGMQPAVHVNNCVTLRSQKNLRFAGNRISVWAPPNAGDASLFTCYDMQYCAFDSNYVEGECQSTWWQGYQRGLYLLNLRDNFKFNTFLRDTFVEKPGSLVQLKWAFLTSGTPTDNVYDFGNRANTYSHCFVKVKGLIEVQDASPANTYTNNVLAFGEVFFAGKGDNTVPMDSCTFSHNTVLTWNTTMFAEPRFTNSNINHNIFYYVNGVTNGVYYNVTPSPLGDSNYNLFYSENPADSTKIMLIGGTPQTVSSVCTGDGIECGSAFGNPQFASTQFNDLNPTPPTTSIVYTHGWPDGYVGAINVSADSTAPNITITWPPLGGSYKPKDLLVFSWTASDNVGVAKVEATYTDAESGRSWITAFTKTYPSTPTSQQDQQGWRIPTRLIGEDLYIKIKVFDTSGNVNWYQQRYTVVPPPDSIDPFRDIAP